LELARERAVVDPECHQHGAAGPCAFASSATPDKGALSS
jgi:hypothetical protein